MACECPVFLKLVLDNKCKQYKISKLSEVHNHTTSNGEFKHYVTSRKLETNDKEEIKTLIDLNVETKNIKTFVKEKTGKSIQTKDINNIKLQAVKEKDGGLSKGDILGNMLKELTVIIRKQNQKVLFKSITKLAKYAVTLQPFCQLVAKLNLKKNS